MTTAGTPLLWGGFVLLVLCFLALDLGLFNRRDHAVKASEAFRWVAVWMGLALAFCGFVAWRFGGAKAVDYLTGYVLELSLSVDNLFVFVLVFGVFRIPDALQHRVLIWGILGALVLRAAMILAGTALLGRFHWLLYLFGAFLVISGARLLLQGDEEPHPERSWAFRTLRRVIPSTGRLEGNRFTVVEEGRRLATPLLLCLVLIELSDVAFALDSVPAIFGVTLDPFIVFTSNVFAILGLRSLYFVLARLMGRFQYLGVGLALVLAFIGVKMILAHWVELPSAVALGVVLALLAGAVGCSAVRSGRERRRLGAGAGEASRAKVGNRP